jgi:hypothetical protein
MEPANYAPAECWGPPSLEISLLPHQKGTQVGSKYGHCSSIVAIKIIEKVIYDSSNNAAQTPAERRRASGQHTAISTVDSWPWMALTGHVASSNHPGTSLAATLERPHSLGTLTNHIALSVTRGVSMLPGSRRLLRLNDAIRTGAGQCFRASSFGGGGGTRAVLPRSRLAGGVSGVVLSARHQLSRI